MRDRITLPDSSPKMTVRAGARCTATNQLIIAKSCLCVRQTTKNAASAASAASLQLRNYSIRPSLVDTIAREAEYQNRDG